MIKFYPNREDLLTLIQQGAGIPVGFLQALLSETWGGVWKDHATQDDKKFFCKMVCHSEMR
jgi:hypothetical protein